MTNRKTRTPVVQPPYAPTEYEQGVLDTLDMLTAAVSAIHDAERQVRGMTIHASPELRTLLAGVNSAANVASHIRAEVERRAHQRLSGRLATSGTTPRQ